MNTDAVQKYKISSCNKEPKEDRIRFEDVMNDVRGACELLAGLVPTLGYAVECQNKEKIGSTNVTLLLGSSLRLVL